MKNMNTLSHVRVEPAPQSDTSSSHSGRNNTVLRRQVSRAASVTSKSFRSSAVLNTNAKLRKVPIMPGEDETDQFCNNAVSTSKYTMLSFLPKSIFEQFRRLANVYFLIISIFQVSTDLSPTSKFATIVPLMCVIGLTVAKEAFEDWKRHIADQRVNTSLTTIVDPKTGSLRKVLCEDIRVGDIVQIHDRDSVQADGVLLSTCDPAGFCYIETSGLDGETNLKIRKAVSTTKLVHKAKNWRKLNGCVKCERPNANIYRFQGYMELLSTKTSILQTASNIDQKLNTSSLKNTAQSDPPLQQQTQNKSVKEVEPKSMAGENPGVKTQRIPLHNDNLLLRGSVLRNTPRAFLLIVYTGSDTKQRQNTNDTPSKRSHVDRLIDQVILLIFISLMLMCIVSTALVLFNTNSESNLALWYIPFVAEASVGTQMTSFITFLILFNNLVPISLYVSIEIVKLMQARLIESDLRMYHELTSTAALVRSSGLNEDLGQIEYVFSDKTGTLTQNSMRFKRLSVIGYVYNSGHEMNIDKIRLDGMQGADIIQKRTSNTVNGRQDAVRSGTRLTRYLRQKREHHQMVRDMLRIMSVCNTVVPERVVDPNGGTIVRMQSASPDEEALVKGANGYGFELLSRDDNALIIKEINEIQKFEILNVLEFSSDRRCMSMIVRTPEDTIELYCKGADDVLFSRLSRPERGTVNPVVHSGTGTDGKSIEEESGLQRFQKETLQHLHWFAVNGLRTLVFAKVELDLDFYEDWNRRFQNAQLLVENKEAELSMLAAEVENELTLVGATAIEDLLQVGVPDAIEKLLNANIKVWMLTGDRMETSINIGLACNLINASMNVIRFGFESEGLMMSELAKGLCQVYGNKLAQKLFSKFSVDDRIFAELIGQNMQRLESKVGGDEDSNEAFLNETERSARQAIVVDGRALTLILQDDLASTLFFKICNACTAVIACRVSPRQKASLVRMVKEHVSPTPMTLAIGDGANDVGMLQEAHIGIGITGNEGAQAVRASDYAIAQFRFLNRLLLIHGNWNYRRITKVILYSFYKNIVNVLTLFYYCFYNGFSGTTLYESWLSAGWNVGWTLFPVIVFGVLDRDLSPDTLFAFPLVYMRGQRQHLFNFRVMALWVLNAVVHSLIVFFISMSALANDVTAANGQASGLWSMGTTVNGCMVIVVNLKIALESAHWTAYYVQSLLFSIALWFLFVYAHSEVTPVSDYANISANLHTKAHPWFLYLLVPISALLVDLSITYLHRMYRPSSVQIAREFEHLQKLGYVQAKTEAEFPEVEGNESTRDEASHITSIANNFLVNSNAIRSTFAFSYPTVESGLRRHDEKEYDESGDPLTEEQGSRQSNKKPKKHKKKHKKKRKKMSRQPIVVINGPTVEELAYFEDQMWSEEQQPLEKAK